MPVVVSQGLALVDSRPSLLETQKKEKEERSIEQGLAELGTKGIATRNKNATRSFQGLTYISVPSHRAPDPTPLSRVLPLQVESIR